MEYKEERKVTIIFSTSEAHTLWRLLQVVEKHLMFNLPESILVSGLKEALGDKSTWMGKDDDYV